LDRIAPERRLAVEPIVAPAPPKSAFNKNRRVSDLLLAQMKHFQHVAHKKGMQIDAALERDVASEAGAARYIATVTRQIHAQARPSGMTVVPPTPGAPAPQPGVVPDPAAAPQPPAAPRSKPAAKKPKKGTKAGS
jgi:hypothetical protein